MCGERSEDLRDSSYEMSQFLSEFLSLRGRTIILLSIYSAEPGTAREYKTAEDRTFLLSTAENSKVRIDLCQFFCGGHGRDSLCVKRWISVRTIGSRKKKAGENRTCFRGDFLLHILSGVDRMNRRDQPFGWFWKHNCSYDRRWRILLRWYRRFMF